MAHGAPSDSSLFLQDLLSNALVAVMVLALVSLARVGSGGGVRLDEPEKKAELQIAAVRQFLPPQAREASVDERLGILVQLESEGPSAHPLWLSVTQPDASPARPDEIRLFRGGDSSPASHHLAFLQAPVGASRRWQLALAGGPASVLRWRVVVNDQVLLIGRGTLTPDPKAAQTVVFNICLDSQGRVSVIPAGRKMLGACPGEA